jgi:hypothetical protein
MQNSGMTIVEPSAKEWGENPQHISYIKISRYGEEKEFTSTRDMVLVIGGNSKTIMQSFARYGKWHGWKLVEIRRGK